ncbi:MAG: TonB family protein [Polyangiaceae bacterium]|nr:TonB family protein [Polyangiaceae bacterium]
MSFPKERLFSLCLAAAVGLCRVAAAQPAPPRAESPPSSGDHRLTKAPRLLEMVEADLPSGTDLPEAAMSVNLELDIGPDGAVVDARVLESRGEPWDSAALGAVKRFRFEPAEIDDVPAGVTVSYRYDFVAKPPEPAAQPVHARFEGRIRDRRTGEALVGVTVELDTGVRTVTDANGRFSFHDVPPGTRAVTLSGSSLTPTMTEESLEAGQTVTAQYDLELAEAEVLIEQGSDFELVVRAPRITKTVSATTVSSEQGTKVAGTGGDVAKVVENMPGVARSSVGSGALVVWGAASQDTRVYVDGVHVPALYHEGGFRSVVHSDLVKSVELQPGGYGANYGRGLGGLVTVTYKPLEADGYHGTVGSDIIDSAASLRGHAGQKFRFAVAARKSYLDWMVKQFTSRDVGEFVPIPRYWDAQVRLAYVPREGEYAEVGGLASSDDIERRVSSADPAEVKSESKHSEFQRVYLNYRRDLDDGGVVRATPYFGLDHTRVDNRVGSIPAELTVDTRTFGFRSEWQGPVAPYAVVSVGLDAEVVVSDSSRVGSLTTPPREGDLRVFGQVPSNQINADDWSATVASVAPFVQADFSAFAGALHLIPGLRFEPTVVRASRIAPPQGALPAVGTTQMDGPLEPRVALRWDATSRVAAKAAFGIYHQPPFAEDLSSVFGNPTFMLGTANHYVLGAAYRLTEPVSAEVTSFFSHSDDLVVRNPAAAPAVAEALVQTGRGRAYGTQFLIRHDMTGRFFGWLSVSMVRSERVDPRTGAWRPFDFDQTFVVTALGSYDLGHGFEVGARARYSTGYPRTPVVGATYDARLDAYQPIFGLHNSVRIPPFYSLDVRAAKEFEFSDRSNLEIYLDVQNVTNHKNPEEIVYNYDYSRQSYITGLPILPVLGAKLTW